MDIFARCELLWGKEGTLRLKGAHVAVFGIGGVGGHVAEALARSGVGCLSLIDNDTVATSNINRQIIALSSTVGMYKTEAMAERIRDINPHCRVITHNCFFLPENTAEFDFTQYSYVVDAVDTVAAKLAIIQQAKAAGVPVISAMGAGNKLHPEMLELCDISQTSVCPLARVMRTGLKKLGITDVKVVYSKEPALKPTEEISTGGKRQTPGSNAFVPASAGLIMAGEVVRHLAYPD